MVICVDVDGTLCNENAWTEAGVASATPRWDIIKKVNDLYDHNFIVIYTARRPKLYFETIKWLWKHGVMFHALACGQGKCPADLYIDDKSVLPEDV